LNFVNYYRGGAIEVLFSLPPPGFQMKSVANAPLVTLTVFLMLFTDWRLVEIEPVKKNSKMKESGLYRYL